MRLYGGKRTKRLIDERTKERQESRDAILWQIDGDECRVKIQGSNEMVVAKYHRNQLQNPSWLRLGNAVRVSHRGGVRGYFEIIGEGCAIPTPISGDTFPAIGGLTDGIMSGLLVSVTDPSSTQLVIEGGTYRLDDTIVTIQAIPVGYILMNDPAPMTMGVENYALGVQMAFLLNAGPADGLFRYDIIVVGADAVLDLVEGIAVAVDPVVPDVPEDHGLVATILRVGGETAIETVDLYVAYSTPVPVILEYVYDSTFEWDAVDDTPETTIQINIKDQYDNAVSNADGWILKFKKQLGTGEVWSIDSGWDADEVQQNLISLSTYTFKYRRNQLVAEVSPAFYITLESNSCIYGFASIVLLDNGGDPV